MYDYSSSTLPTSYVVLDFETTGFSAMLDEPIQVAAVRYIDFEEREQFVTFIRPKKAIPYKITQLTGITAADVADAPTIHDVFPALVQFIGKDVLIAHNAPFDMGFLHANIKKAGLPYHQFNVIDTVKLAKQFIRTPNHKLPTLKAFLKLHHFDSHEALSDCYVTSAVYQYCYERSIK